MFQPIVDAISLEQKCSKLILAYRNFALLLLLSKYFGMFDLYVGYAISSAVFYKYLIFVYFCKMFSRNIIFNLPIIWKIITKRFGVLGYFLEESE